MNRNRQETNVSAGDLPPPPPPPPSITNPIIQQQLQTQPLRIKTTSIYSDYIMTDNVLGLGINGKVIECRSKMTGQKYAIKVIILFD